MKKAWMVFVMLGFLAGSGCLWERNLGKRMARMQMGLNSRRVVTTPPDTENVARRRQLQPGSSPRTVTGAPERGGIEPPLQAGVTGSLQFTMRYLRHLYLGGEIEAGPLGRVGSYLGGAYGVVGAEATSWRGSISVEMVAGRQWLRHELGADDVPDTIFEPRVRGQLALAPQVTFGGVLGASAIPDDRGWLVGFYFGFYSTEIDGKK